MLLPHLTYLRDIGDVKPECDRRPFDFLKKSFGRGRCWEASSTDNSPPIHVFCLQERLRGDRFARHWHDVVRLDDAGFADKAFADRQLANAVAKHKSMFFAEKATDRSPIDYAAAVNGNLVLTPSGEGLRALGEDYARMVDDGLLLGDSEGFEHLIERCAQIQARANKADTSKEPIAI